MVHLGALFILHNVYLLFVNCHHRLHSQVVLHFLNVHLKLDCQTYFLLLNQYYHYKCMALVAVPFLSFSGMDEIGILDEDLAEGKKILCDYQKI